MVFVWSGVGGKCGGECGGGKMLCSCAVVRSFRLESGVVHIYVPDSAWMVDTWVDD